MLDPDAIVAAAIEAAGGLDDFDGDEWREGLEVFVASARSEGRLNELGPFVAVSQITGALANRLRVIAEHRRHPEIAATPVAAPIVILGQPRTGTTILFDLLAQDPAIRAPLTWEVIAPTPPPETATYLTDPRIAEAEVATSMSEAALPGFQRIHPSGPRRGQECVAITLGDLRSMLLSTVYRVPTYMRWLLDEADMSSAYRYHRQFLQVLQWKHPGERWVLKTPAHLWHLSEMFAAYPDATIIHTHRDPLKVVASVSSLTERLHLLGRDETSLSEQAEEWLPYLTDGNNRAVAARRDGTVRADQVIDVAFADFMSDTFGTIESIYQQLDRPFTPESRAAMEQFLADNPADKHGKHTYSFAETNLDLAEARALTANYEQYFSVPQEPLN